VIVGRVWKNLELRVREARMLKAELSGQFWLELRMLIGMWTVKTSHYASGGIWNV
jgi:hypothetical protein